MHGGRVGPVPGNSLAGVLSALDLGAHGVEVDVRMTADGVLVLCHDADPRRVGGPATPIRSLTSGELPPHVARLDAVLDAARGRGQVLLEVKNMPGEVDFDAPRESVAHALCDLLTARSGDDVVVSSFDWFAIDVVRARLPGVPTAFITPIGVAAEACVAYVADSGHAQCHPHASAVLVQPEQVDVAHAAGLEVVCWTVDVPEDAVELATAGVDGVVTNDPGGVLAALASARQRSDDDGERAADAAVGD
jgi:glycerophosphoryl diester phosphodiesterase